MIRGRRSPVDSRQPRSAGRGPMASNADGGSRQAVIGEWGPTPGRHDRAVPHRTWGTSGPIPSGTGRSGVYDASIVVTGKVERLEPSERALLL